MDRSTRADQGNEMTTEQMLYRASQAKQLEQRLQHQATHDSLTDWYKHFRTKGQIERTLESLGAVAIWCGYGGNGVEARCGRPPF